MSNEIPAGTTPVSPPNSTMAVVSLISGILGLTLLPIIGGLVALFTGYYARKEIRESYGALGGEGLATIGIVLGWISIALMAIVCLCIGCSLVFGLSLFGIAASESSLLLAALI